MATVNMPTRNPDNDPLNLLIKGLGIAQSVYGIRANMAAIDDHAQKQQAQTDLDNGKYTKNQQLMLSEKFDVSSTPYAEGDYQTATDSSGSPLYLRVKKDQSPLVERVKTQRGGKNIEVAFDLKHKGADGKPLELGVWDAPAENPKGSWQEFANAEGKNVKQWVVDGSAGQLASRTASPQMTKIETVDEKGTPIQKFVEQRAGQSYPLANKEDKAAKKGEQEANYRYISIKNNALKLKDIVSKVGTNVTKGPEGAEMDSLIYQMAIDYAKLVDPASVAREGEVASAQKYMLPIRENYGLTTSNDTAKKLIDNYLIDLNARLEARVAANNGESDAVTYRPKQDNPGDGTALAAPTSAHPPVITPDDLSAIQYIKDNPNDPKSAIAAQKLKAKGIDPTGGK